MKPAFVLFLVLVARPLAAQERVHILADSSGWILSQRVDLRTGSYWCEVANTKGGVLFSQPGGDGQARFEVPLVGDPLEILPAVLDSVWIYVDGRPPVLRLANATERRQNALVLRGYTAMLLYGARQLRLRATYRIPDESRSKGFQMLEIDLTGLSAFAAQVQRRDCR